MPSYRFCRPDDIPYLVRAVDECWRPHFPHEPPMTVERFRQEMKWLDVWPSNSMVASSNDGPIAVMIGTKRAREVRVLRLGVRPGHQRQGHGIHLLTSLSHKLAVLGPERLLIELPAFLRGLAPFLEAAGYRHETTYTDFERATAYSAPDASLDPFLAPVSVAELASAGLLVAGDIAWERQVATLKGYGDDLEGLAFVSPGGIEAFALSRPLADAGGCREVLGLGARPGAQASRCLAAVLDRLSNRAGTTLRLPKLAPDELPADLLAALGLRAVGEHERWAARAEPA